MCCNKRIIQESNVTRLTNDIRDSIERDLIRHRFQPEIDEIEDRLQAIGAEVYDAAYDADTQAKMQSLPDGWLFQDDAFEVVFVGKRVRIHFSGYMYRGEKFGGLIENRPKVFRRVLEKHRNGVIASFAADHSLSQAFETINIDRERLKEVIQIAKRQTRAALNAVSTVEALIKTWPEVKPFAERWIEGKDSRPKLPAIPVENLNASLGLPVEGAAA